MTTVKAGILSVVLMAVIYGLLTYAGAQSVNVMAPTEEGGSAFNRIAVHYFGTFGSVLLGITITFACLKTAIGLIQSCSETFSEEMFPNSFKYKPYAIGFALVSFILANMGLERIISFAVPVLVLLYPMSIVIILLCLAGRAFGYDKKVFVCAMAFTAVSAVCDMVRALSDGVRAAIPGWESVDKLYSMLPLSENGMGWVIPATVGTIVGLIIMAATRGSKTGGEVA